MRTHPTLSRWIGLVGVLCLSLPTSVRALTGEEVVANVRRRFEALKDLSADFQRTLVVRAMGTRQTFKGRLYLKRPDKSRVETEGQIIATDGASDWVYTPENKQVVVSAHQESPDAPGPERILFEYTEGYKAEYVGLEKVGGRPCHVVRLTAKEEDAPIQTLKAWIDGSRWLPLRVEYADGDGNETAYTLSRLKVDAKLGEGLFRLEAPEGVEVVDLRK